KVVPTRMGRTNAEAPSPSSRRNGRTGRENENTTVTRPVTCEDRWCSRLTVTGEPGTPAGDSRRGRFALKQGIPCKGENLPLVLDFGGLIEVTRRVTCEDRWCARLTVTGEPGTPAGDSRRRRFALKQGIPCKGENLPLGLDFGGLIEGTLENFKYFTGDCPNVVAHQGASPRDWRPQRDTPGSGSALSGPHLERA